MASAGQVVGQQHIADAENTLGAIAEADLNLAFQSDHVLAARGGVPVDEAARLVAPEVDILSVLDCRPFRLGDLLLRQVNLFKMGLAIVSGVDAHDLHWASVKKEIW